MYVNKSMCLLLTGSCVQLVNYVVLVLQVFVVCGLIIGALALGEKVLNAWLCVVAISMNLLVLKQINLFGLSVTATDSLAVSYMLGLSLLQEYFGTKAARTHACMAVGISVGFLLLTILHNFYIPNEFDLTSDSYHMILGTMPRLCFASAFTFLAVQMVDIFVFQAMRRQLNGRMLTMRIFLCVLFSQCLDTIIFSFLGLYGEVEKIGDVILISIVFKTIVLFVATPFVTLCKKIVHDREDTQYKWATPLHTLCTMTQYGKLNN